MLLKVDKEGPSITINQPSSTSYLLHWPPSLPATCGEGAYGGWITAGNLALGLSLVVAGFLLWQRRSLG